MKRLVINCVILMAFLLTFCKTANHNAGNEKSGNESRKNPIETVVIDREFVYENSLKEVQILSSSLKDSVLSLSISFTGCKGDVPELVFDGSYLKSYPPKAQLSFWLRKGSKTCGENVKGDFSYNLSPIKSSGSKTLVIMLPGYQENLTYQY